MSHKVARYRRRAGAPARPGTAVPTSWHAAKETYALVTLNYKSVARIGAVPLLIIGSLQTLYAIYPTLLNLLLTVCGNLAATGMFAVGLQQLVARSVQNQLYRFRFGNRAWRIAAAVMLALIPVVMLSLGILALGYVLAQNLLAPSFLGILLLFGIVAGLALAAYTAVRFSVIMPAIALDEPIDLQSAVRATRGRAWQLWRGLLATLSPVLIIAAGLSFYTAKSGSAAWAASSLQGFTIVTSVPLAVVFLTLSYFRYVRREAKPKMKVIGEPAFHIRMWYDLQRYVMLVLRTAGILLKQLQPKAKIKPAPQARRQEPTLRRQAAPASAAARTKPAAPKPSPAPQPSKEALARKVAERLADMEEEKLARLAALLEKDEPVAEPKMAANTAAKKLAATADDVAPVPTRRIKSTQRSAGARSLNDMLAANENETVNKVKDN
ncbi:MAG TPA: hypothetical protein PKW15_00215 [Alphaproteobacteria bacterium]|nr:hypothetical protein [Rhodospirillaceae bacterium]HRJ11648.1 hypothetical protein [Alphaproteobacteria bacterium]